MKLQETYGSGQWNVIFGMEHLPGVMNVTKLPGKTMSWTVNGSLMK